MRESAIEKKFIRELRKLGCAAYKFVSPGNGGVPDRIVITPRGRVVFVELKTDAGKLSPVQKAQVGRLRKHKQDVRVLYGPEGVAEFIEEVARYEV